MWNTKKQQLANDQIVWFEIKSEESPLLYKDAIRLWKQSVTFRNFFIDLLLSSPFEAYRWETPPISNENADRPFEFVMLDSPNLVRQANTNSFAEYFHDSAPEGVVKFHNLRKDAILVVPSPVSSANNYSHLGAFTRNAPRSQQHELWKLVGNSMQSRLNDIPVWLSSAGAGVAWLHIRLDDKPKYYGYNLYREST